MSGFLDQVIPVFFLLPLPIPKAGMKAQVGLHLREKKIRQTQPCETKWGSGDQVCKGAAWSVLGPELSPEQTNFWVGLAWGIDEFSWTNTQHRKEQMPDKTLSLGFFL